LYVCVELFAAFQANKVVYISDNNVERFSLGPTAEALRTKIGNCRFVEGRGHFGPKFHKPTNHSLCRNNNGMNLSFVRYKNIGRSCFRFLTMHAFGRQTDRRTDSMLIKVIEITLKTARS